MRHFGKSTMRESLPSTSKRAALQAFLKGAAFLLAISAIFTLLSPIPAALVIRAAFRKSIAVAPANYSEMENRIDIVKNASYPSALPDNTLDLYLPKNKTGRLPVVLWVHGGAFVGGDKSDVALYATALAAEGFAVVCMNYRRAPEAKYPAPLTQTQDAYRWLKESADLYSFDLNRFVLAGDSAGAHIVAQFAAIQSNSAYAAEMNFEQTVPLHTLKALLLFCGPFDVAKMDAGNNATMNFFIGRAAWAYFGTNDWATQYAHQATISNHVTKTFPAAFITDGNHFSFESHGRELADALEQKGVPVETYFIPSGTETAEHEYQFQMNTAAGEESFRQAVDFLKKHTQAAAI